MWLCALVAGFVVTSPAMLVYGVIDVAQCSRFGRRRPFIFVGCLLICLAIVLGIASFLIEPMCRKLTPRVVWVMSNFIMFVSMAATAIISAWSLKSFHGSVLFAALGVPQAILFSVPFAVTAQLDAKC
ncbi:sucrose transport protein SUT1-like [Curcuma longa]|uniref:sucrose transport protein SUT1-like n=1 Tax=Curcuma longa TaxID=136217 RepID=UPI003D9F8F9E